jgi:hypothetical protein
MILYNNNYLPLIYVHVYKNYRYNHIATFSVQTIYLNEVLYSKIGLNHGRVHDIVIIYEYIKLFNGDFLRCKGHQLVSLL